MKLLIAFLVEAEAAMKDSGFHFKRKPQARPS